MPILPRWLIYQDASVKSYHQIVTYRFPIPDSRLPIPDSRFPIPNS
ncbi:MAG: hypothetical protein F6K26_38355 [Moorea sp. SIO2I5]|nr:hypothetical protein [Moorena sp. SIO2I5]